jgi:hypothetical protein
MASDQHLASHREPAPDAPEPMPAPQTPAVSELSGEGGDPACWACKVCEECGAVVSEGHLAGCSLRELPPGLLDAAVPASAPQVS